MSPLADTRPGPPRPGGTFSLPLRVLAAAAGLLALVLLVGLLLPGRWQAERTVTVAAPADSVFARLQDPRRWDDWAPMGDVESVFSGPERGAGATRSWDHPEMGNGVFEIVASRAPTELRYRVRVQDGSLVTEGTFRLDPVAGGTRVTWTERGDFGPNPLMGFLAPAMDRMQGNQLEHALTRLRERVEAGG